MAEDNTICGIFGAIAQPGKKINMGTMRALTWANRERGTDSCGFFRSDGKMNKHADDPAKVLLDTGVSKWLKSSRDSAWFVAGHTRFATRGKVNRRNSHPFRYGRIIGSHNGMCNAPDKYKVDSEYLFWLLNKARGDYNQALGDTGGYWGLSWFDGEDFYLMSHNGELAVVEVEGVYYYSSSWKHLDACTGGDCHTFGEGEVWKFNKDGFVGSSNQPNSHVAAFVSTGGKWGYYNSSAYSGYSTSRNYASGGRETSCRKASGYWLEDADQTSGAASRSSAVREYDAEWAEAWGTYCNEESAGGIHGMTDEEFEDSQYAG